jgi:hypothetical protein
LAFWTSLPGVLTGAAALITAVVTLVGLWPTSGKGHNDQPGASTVSERDPAAEASQPETPLTTAAQPNKATTAGGGGVGELIGRGQVTLGDGDNVDLVSGVVSSGVSNDLYLQGNSPDLGDLYTVREAMVITPKLRNRAGCVAALNSRRVDRVPIGELKAGTPVCITTEEGHVAALRIIRPVAIGHPQLVFTYSLWR